MELAKFKFKDSEPRTLPQIREHYLLEKRLAKQLKQSSGEERLNQRLYATLCDELFREILHHSQLSRPSNTKTEYLISQRVSFLTNVFQEDTTFLEIGCGNGHLTSKVAEKVKKVYAIDVSEELVQALVLPNNVELIISDGIHIPVPESSVDVAYSHQLIEHLHPDDAVEQLLAIHRALKPGGVYVCVTPNRLCGPHDVSKYFDNIATGFHLREYSVSELFKLFRQSGFSKISLYKIYRKSRIFQLPMTPEIGHLFKSSEQVLEQLPVQLRRQLANSPLFFRSITMVGVK